MRTSTATYRRVVKQIQTLTADEQLRLLQDLTKMVQNSVVGTSKPNLMDLQGLDKELWRGVDVDTYINEERESWNG
ncbi:MAG: hypothetical protein KBG20_00895 [Caldilineaceae bacterium]|nr:hypothetical protein [Caldilineaceae bacterium]MBP8108822.1 hypothetical protein [Caldilineaceae bacterium]MBP8121067.1 hypothetical protein [Caldilineaceae bacterium]MBP9070816.1 hypothetical protein [Caldilineaceae bacterium]